MTTEEQKQLDRQWMLNFASKTTAIALDDLTITELLRFEDVLERNGVNTDDFTGEEKLSELLPATGLFAHLYGEE